MVNVGIRTLVEPDGTPVCNTTFDLSAQQLRAAAHACAEVRLERHRGHDLEIDDVLALRELTGVCDELDRLADAGANASVVLPLARLGALDDALHEWADGREERGWLREADEEALPLVRAMIGPMDDLRADALRACLGSGAEAEH